MYKISISIFSIFLLCCSFSQKKNTTSFERGIFMQAINSGMLWSSYNNNLPKNTQVSFLAEMNGKIILATENHGLFFSKNINEGWEKMATKIFPNNKITSIHILDKKIYVGIYRSGIFASEDEGKTWKNLTNNLPNQSVMSISNIGNELLAGTDIGLFKASKNTNWQWEKIISGPQISSIAKTENDAHLFAGTSRGILISTDRGKNWEWIQENTSLHNIKITNQKIYAMTISDGLQISENFGKTWEKAIGFPNNAYVFEIVEDGKNLICAQHGGIFQSKDGGKTWWKIYDTPREKFLDLIQIDGNIYGGTVLRN